MTPKLSQDYVRRDAAHQAAFLLPFLAPKMELLDIGCGPGTITVGLARAVAPRRVMGIDHDRTHVQAARSLAKDRSQANASFRRASVFALPFTDNSFDVVFENDVFVHLSDRAGEAAREALRVTKPGGLFAARDAHAGLAIWEPPHEDLHVLDRLMISWQASRGSDVCLGSRLPSIIRRAGFDVIRKSVSADTKGDLETVQAHAAITIGLLDGPLGRTALDRGWGVSGDIERLKKTVRLWAGHPDAFFANLHIEVIGRKPT